VPGSLSPGVSHFHLLHRGDETQEMGWDVKTDREQPGLAASASQKWNDTGSSLLALTFHLNAYPRGPEKA
jgi:hypothetical protein